MDIRKTDAFDRWVRSLRDTRGRAKVLVRIERLAMGNPGDVAPIGEGCSELRIQDGPGYRVYYRQEGERITLLLGGDKATQAQDIAEAYFGSTYVDGVIDRHVKPFLNSVVRRSVRVQCENRPNPRKIAVISDLWSPTHSVYRNYYKYLKSLKGKYHLTFFHCLHNEGLDLSLFDEVHRLNFQNGVMDFGPLLKNDFAVAYFADVGMSLTSR